MSDEQTLQSQTSAKTAAQYVDAIVKRDAELATQPTKPYRVRRSLVPFLAVLVPLFLGLTAFNVLVATKSPETFDKAEQEAAVYFTMMLTRSDVEAYRDSTGTLPTSLDLLGLGQLGVRYTPLADGYVLSASVGDSTVTYRQGDDMSSITTAFESLAELSR